MTAPVPGELPADREWICHLPVIIYLPYRLGMPFGRLHALRIRPDVPRIPVAIVLDAILFDQQINPSAPHPDCTPKLVFWSSLVKEDRLSECRDHVHRHDVRDLLTMRNRIPPEEETVEAGPHVPQRNSGTLVPAITVKDSVARV